jgi:hypothetical protein
MKTKILYNSDSNGQCNIAKKIGLWYNTKKVVYDGERYSPQEV